jgi:hypothetical protein
MKAIAITRSNGFITHRVLGNRPERARAMIRIKRYDVSVGVLSLKAKPCGVTEKLL